MNKYWDILLKPVLAKAGVRKIVEIGAQGGLNTITIIDYCKKHNGKLYSIDPIPSFDVKEWEKQYANHFCFHEELSLNALPKITGYDAVLIDGDHNWYTVYNELKLIEKTFAGLDDFPLIFIHDIEWPYGRRDLYYNPDNIPLAYQQPYKKSGISLGKGSLTDKGYNPHLYNSIYENNLKNGVLTAVEDFLSETKFKLEFIKFSGFHGIGILIQEKEAELIEFIRHLDYYPAIVGKLEEQRIQQLIKIKGLKEESVDLREKVAELEIVLEEAGTTWAIEKKQFEQEISSIRETIAGLIHEKETQSALISEKEADLQQLSEKLLSYDQNDKIYAAAKAQIELLEKKVRSKEVIINNLYQENNIHLNSIKYRLGNTIVNALRSPKAAFKLPLNILRLFLEGLNKKRKPQKVRIAKPVNTEKQVDANVSVIVCVHNALDDVKACLESIIAKKSIDFELVIVDDGSDNETSKFLCKFVEKNGCHLVRNDVARGYTIAANQGLKKIKAQYSILLNSDTIVTFGWIEKLIECMESDTSTGIVGPLSNAASWQSVPEIKEGNDWAVNVLEPNMRLEQMSRLVETASKKVFPKVPFVNGFCYMIHSKVIEKIGYLDEETFPRGYGEEDDFSIRARKTGFQLRVADHCYIYHSKSKSFTPQKRKELVQNAKGLIYKKHSQETIKHDISILQNNEELPEIRSRVKDAMEKFKNNKEQSINALESKKKGVIYTAIMGQYDNLRDPEFISSNFDYVCFTDSSVIKSDVWKIIRLDSSDLDATRRARQVKILPHIFLPDYEISIWVDGNLSIIYDVNELVDEYLATNTSAFFRHTESGTCLYDEAEACKRLGKDSEDVINKQVARYRAEGYPEQNGLISTGVIIRKHNSPDVIKVMEDWWFEIVNYSKRDQISFNYVAWKNNFQYGYIDFYIRDNKYFFWRVHDSKIQVLA